MRRCGLVVLTLACALLAFSPAAFGSQLIDRNPRGLTLQLNNKGEALAALGRYQDAIECFNTAISLNPNYTRAQQNLQAAMGKGQVSVSGNTPTPTEAPWYLGGVAPTSVTPTPVVSQTTIASVQTQQTTTTPTSLRTTPIPTRTTFTPLSVVPAFAGIGAATLLLAGAGKRKNR